MAFVVKDKILFDSESRLNPPTPCVTVICISYNQQEFVRYALQSVITQNYPNVELLIIDNASTDNTAFQILEFIQPYPAIRFIRNPVNVGLNRAFNQGLALANGPYIIDLSADDVLLPDRIARQVACFEELPETYGVVFSNAAYIDAGGQTTGTHYPIDPTTRLARVAVPSGSIFRHILAAYFICTPTMMMRRAVLDALKGYDESLSYEDFDFWVRSSRLFKYAYLDAILTFKRNHPHSFSTQVTQPHNALLPSTLIVCRKAVALCNTPDEYRALAGRIQTFVRKAFYAEQFGLAQQFGHLLRQIATPDRLTSAVLLMSRLHLPVNRLYRWYICRRRARRNETGFSKFSFIQ